MVDHYLGCICEEMPEEITSLRSLNKGLGLRFPCQVVSRADAQLRAEAPPRCSGTCEDGHMLVCGLKLFINITLKSKKKMTLFAGHNVSF